MIAMVKVETAGYSARNGAGNEHGNVRLEYKGVRITAAAISEVRKERISLHIPNEKIRSIELCYGIGAERPLFQGIAGVAFLVGGIALPIRSLALLEAEGRIVISNYGLFIPVVFLALGAWLLWNLLRRRTYLRVHLQSDTRKVGFKGAIERTDILEFIARANDEFGCAINTVNWNTNSQD